MEISLGKYKRRFIPCEPNIQRTEDRVTHFEFLSNLVIFFTNSRMNFNFQI